MYGMDLLKEIIEKSGYKLRYVAEKCGITYAGLKKKLDGEHEFKASEIAALKFFLNLSDEQVHRIFFAQKVEL